MLGLFLLVLLGLSVTHVTQTEIMAASQERTLERTFYAAESGLQLSIAGALARGDFAARTHVAQRTEVEQGRLAALEDRVDSSPFFCLGDAPCAFCSINQGSEFVRRNHVVAVNAVRGDVVVHDESGVLGRKSLTSMVDVEPMQSVLDCLAELPSAAAAFRFSDS